MKWPEMPAGIEDRNADVWEALLAVADLAGGHWPDRARVSAVSLVTQSSDRSGSLGVILLRDLRAVFGDVDKLPTETILERLHEIEESPWADLRGKPLDARGLSRRLSKYDVRPTVYRDGTGTIRGYLAADLADPWSRYVDDVTAVTAVTDSSDPTGVDVATDTQDPWKQPPTPQQTYSGAAPRSPRSDVTSETPQQPSLYSIAAAPTAGDCCRVCGDQLGTADTADLCGMCEMRSA